MRGSVICMAEGVVDPLGGVRILSANRTIALLNSRVQARSKFRISSFSSWGVFGLLFGTTRMWPMVRPRRKRPECERTLDFGPRHLPTVSGMPNKPKAVSINEDRRKLVAECDGQSVHP